MHNLRGFLCMALSQTSIQCRFGNRERHQLSINSPLYNKRKLYQTEKDNLPKFQVYLQRICFKVSFILNDSKQNGSDSQKPRETFESNLIGTQGPRQDPQIILILFLLAIKSRIEKIHIGNHYFRLGYYRFTMPFAFENVLNDDSSIWTS